MLKLQKAGILIVYVVFPGYLFADTAGEQSEIRQLQQAIKITKIKNQVVRNRNMELNAKLRELEAKIAEMQESLRQEKQAEEE